jgi:hypothetical protein
MKKSLRIGRIGAGISLLAAVMAVAGAAGAAQLVTFTRGQAIVVQGVEKRGVWYYFTLDHGGQMGVPVNRVASIEEYEAPAGAPATPAPEAVAATPPAPNPGVAPATNPEGAPAPAEPPPADMASRPDPASAAGTNVAAPGTEDWRYKVRMSGGPKRKEVGMSPNGPGGPGMRGPMGGRIPPGQRRFPPQPPNPQN